MGPTLTLISLENGRRLAAYAQSSWDGSLKSYISGSKNVLYSFNAMKYRTSKTYAKYGQYSRGDRGPTFGRGHDFYIGTDMTNVAKCRSYSFSGPASSADVCGDLGDGGGKVVHLEVYALGEIRRHPIHAIHAMPVWSIHLICIFRRLSVESMILPNTSISFTPDLCSGLRRRLHGRVPAPRAAPAPTAAAEAALAPVPAAPAAHARSHRG
jgi:hypothetical protein